jgi:hypothetical protein
MRLLAFLALIGVLGLPGTALAQGKTADKAASGKAPNGKPPAGKEAAAPNGTQPAAPAGREKGVAGARSAGQVQGTVKTEQDKEGVKTYTFGALELEGRLKSPQILYFLRRVRAEFDPTGLGHRSFMRELSDTRRSRAVR